MISNSIQQFVTNFQTDIGNNDFVTAGLASRNSIRNVIPNTLRAEANVSDEYSITGSVGQLNFPFTKTPWFGIFDNEITDSAQRGFYIVYLFKTDLSGFYISLNQGFTQYTQKYSGVQSRLKIRSNALTARGLLNGVYPFSFDDIYLVSNTILARGYELGNICSKYYNINALPSDQDFIVDLNNLMGVYRELKGLVGNNIMDVPNVVPEDDFQDRIQLVPPATLPAGPIGKRERLPHNPNLGGWPRDLEIASTALRNANYTCEHDATHLTFLSNVTQHQFMEAHHLIPMGKQDLFQYSLDVPENIICLCPNCHRGFHHGDIAYKTSIITQFYNSRIQQLRTRGVDIDLESIIQFYN